MLYLSYQTVGRDHEAQQTVREWNTVKVVAEGKQVENKQGVKVGIGPFLRLRHFFHEDEFVEYPK